MIVKLYHMLKRNGWLMAVSLSLALAYSCQDEIEVSQRPVSGDEIAFSVFADSVWTSVSRSAISSEGKPFFLTAVGEDSLYISVTESENDIFPFAENADSTDSRAASLLSRTLTAFKMTAFLEANGGFSEFMKNQAVSRDPSTGNCTYSPIKYWPQDQSQYVHFFGYAQTSGTESPSVTPHFEVTKVDGNNVYLGTFNNYQLPATDNVNEDDAIQQSDLIFAVTPQRNKGNGTVALNFKHALTAIVFKIKNVPANVRVDAISFTGLHSQGNCVMTGAGDDLSFTWTTTDVTPAGTYIQTFGHTVTSSPDVNEISSTEDAKCFMMIPQTIPDDATLNVYVTINGNTYDIPMTKKLKEISSQWLPNKKYTYIISLPDEVEVLVDDKVDEATEKIKSDLVIKNTGIAPIYVRAAIIGNWVVEKNKDGNTTYEVVAEWQSTDGTFNWGAGEEPNTPITPVRNWLKGTDGFYYYTQEIARGDSIPSADKLFDTYTLTANAPLPDAVLDLTIAVQAVMWDDLRTPIGGKYIWPDEIVTKLNEIRNNP